MQYQELQTQFEMERLMNFVEAGSSGDNFNEDLALSWLQPHLHDQPDQDEFGFTIPHPTNPTHLYIDSFLEQLSSLDNQKSQPDRQLFDEFNIFQSEMAQNQQTFTEFTSTAPIQNQPHSQLKVSRRRAKRSDGQPMERSQKNYMGNITKQCISIVLRKYGARIKRDLQRYYCSELHSDCTHSCAFCTKGQESYKELTKYYQTVKQTMHGPNNIGKMLCIGRDEEERVRKEIFYRYFEKVLRNGDYAMYVITIGKMVNKEAYISLKNKYLLYFVDNIRKR